MNKYLNKIRFSSDNLKIIACILMFIDHASFCLLNYYMTVYYMDILPQTYTKLNQLYKFGRGIGRIAFPIFCFFLVEGFFRTHNIKKYISRLAIFALLSEIPFDLAHYKVLIHNDHQNVMFSLLLGLLMMLLLKSINLGIAGLSNSVKVITSICAVAGFCELASLIHVDYSYKGILLIAALYFFHEYKPLNLIAGAAVNSWEANGPVAFLLLYFYDPEIKPRFKYFFYWFYPCHLFLIYLVALLLFQ